MYTQTVANSVLNKNESYFPSMLFQLILFNIDLEYLLHLTTNK